MTDLRERDAMICRGCGNEERASEGYPCADCGTFLCIICSFRGVLHCRACTSALQEKIETPDTPSREIPLIDWPEH
ncbi:MAG TPA: hypothetical protein VM939_02655 [Gemmatimonadaceae bacterium]|nr:hypothetical protein [Gemmatimonadaceae bacterium]